MANKKTQTSKKSPVKSTKQAAQTSFQSEEFSRVAGIVIFALSVIFFCLAIIRGAGAWEFLHGVYVGIFGILAACLFPLIVLAITLIYSYTHASNKMMITKLVETFILVFILTTMVHVFRNSIGDDFSSAVVNSYQNATSEFNGGVIGAVFGWLLLSLGKAPAVIVSIVLFLVDFMLLTGLTIIQFFKPAKVTYDKSAQAITEHRERRRMNKENIDIPLDDDESIAEQTKKKSRKKAQSDDEGYDSIIDEINAEAEKKRRERISDKSDKSEKPQKKNKSIDEIVEDAAKKEEKRPESVEAFTVSKEQMDATVADYQLPPIDLLKKVKKASSKDTGAELKENAQLLIDTLHSFNVDATITDISRGPTVTRYELKPAAGIRISKITNLADDIALNLAATNVRIEAPIPGKAAVGIELPNTVKSTVSMRELIEDPEFAAQKSKLSAGIGKDIAGKSVFCDIAKMPHLLIAGTTGSGKSVCVNSIIASILYRATPDEVKFLMIDPKTVEFSKYEGIPHLLVPVVTDPRKAAGALGWAVSEMLQRYQELSHIGVRDIASYNKYADKHEDVDHMPKIVIFIDEFADLMMAAPKEVEDSVCRLAQMARAVGMHLVIATQRPSVDVITGLIKANISSRIALTVSSQIDSRTILDSSGAEKLLGYGDMLYNPIGASKPVRVQGCFISDEEVGALCDFIKNQGESQYSDDIQKEIEAKAVQDKKSSPFETDGEDGEQLDALFDKAVDVVLETGQASTSFLQRKLSVGYARGAKIIDQLEDKHIIGPANGSKPREILITRQQWIQMQANGSADEFTAENTEQMSFEDTEAAEDDFVVEENYNEDEE